MAVYDADGNVLTTVYDADGNALNYAYDADGNVIYQKEPTRFKVMEYNVGGWYTGGGSNVPADRDEEYYNLQSGMIERADADILVLNEYWRTFSKLPRTAESMLSQYYQYIETMDETQQYAGRAICSKYPVSNVRSIGLSPVGKGLAVDVTIDGNVITVIDVHLSTDATERAEQVQSIIPIMEAMNMVILAGDLNSIWCTTETDSDYIAIIKPFLDAGFHLANCSNFGYLQTYGNPSSSNSGYYTRALDNIITSPNINILSATVDRTKETDALDDKVDHMPLIAELQIS